MSSQAEVASLLTALRAKLSSYKKQLAYYEKWVAVYKQEEKELEEKLKGTENE